MPRLATGRGIRKHWTYDVAEIAATCDVHRNTLRQWIKDGLATVSEGKPFLINGGDLKAFLRDRSAARKQPCGNSRIYCLPCRAPKRPAGGMVDCEQTSQSSGTLVGICPDCDRVIRRHVSLKTLDDVTSGLDVRILNTGAGSTLGNAANHRVYRDSSEVKNP